MGGDIVFEFEIIDRADVWIFSGTDRKNITTVVEDNLPAAVGAPYRITLDDGAVVVS